MTYCDPSDAEKVKNFEEIKQHMPALLSNYFKEKSAEELNAIEKELESLVANAFKAYFKRDYYTAKELCKRTIEIFPGDANGWQILGMIALSKGKTDLAIELLQYAIVLLPNSCILYGNLGHAYLQKKSKADAIQAYEKALELKPDHVDVMCNLGVAYSDAHLLQKSQELLFKAIQLYPEVPNFYINLFGTYLKQGKSDLALGIFNQMIKMADKGSFKNHRDISLEAFSRYYGAFLFGSVGLFTLTGDELLEFHLRWTQRFCTFLPEECHTHTNHKKHTKLRIGYASADFHDHPVGRFIFNHLRFHDRERFEIYCYNDVPVIDRISAKMQEFPIHWRTCAGFTDEEIALAIFKDEIDILVDLSGHSSGGKMRALHYNPAPIMMHYLGYPASTGHPDIHYRFADPLVDRPEDQKHFSEKFIYLRDGLWSYHVDETDKEDFPPYIPNKAIVFGSFNALHKICDQTVATWIKILKKVPNSSLVLKTQALNCSETRHFWRNKFTSQGIEATRIQIMPAMTRKEHLIFSSQVDIALDPWPYNGTTTTCDLFLAGVPVIALRGERHSERVCAGLLQRLGLEELIANSPEEYISIAVNLAQDPERLINLHRDVRHRFCHSPLLENPTITRQIEEQYELLWKNYQEENLNLMAASTPIFEESN